MATINDAAKEYVPQQTKNIADLPEFSGDANIMDGDGIDDKGVPFKYKYIQVNGERYRIPGAVIGQIKDIKSVNQNANRFKVKKSGSGLQTRYTTMQIV